MVTTIYKWIPTSDSALVATIVILSICNMILALWLNNVAWMLMSAFLWVSLFIRIVFSGNGDIDSAETKKQEIKPNSVNLDCLQATYTNEQESQYISIDTYNVLVSKLASEMYVVIGAMYAADEKMPDSTYETLLDKILNIINNPSILQSNKELLTPLDNKYK